MAFYVVTIVDSAAAISVTTGELYEVQSPDPGTRGRLRTHEYVDPGTYVVKFDDGATWNVELKSEGGSRSLAYTVHSSEAAPVRGATRKSE